MRSAPLESCSLLQDMAAAECEIGMLRKRSLQQAVIIDLEFEELARGVRPRSSSPDDCTFKEIGERCFTPISLPIEYLSQDRCSTPTQPREARCCTPPTVPIKANHDSSDYRCCTPFTIPLNSRDFKMDAPLAPIRETLIARPKHFFNNQDQTTRGWTSNLARFMSGSMPFDANV